ncbi:hypothetical protein ILUMI_18543, partial [Ignelater luminosus]
MKTLPMRIYSSHDSESAVSSDGFKDNASESEEDQVTNKDKFYYVEKTFSNGVKGIARGNQPGNVLQVWKLFVTNHMLNIILVHTNEKIAISQNKFKKPFPTYTKDLNVIELKAYIGLLHLSGIIKSGHQDVELLFASDGTGRQIFRATMIVFRLLWPVCVLGTLRMNKPQIPLEFKPNRKRVVGSTEFEHANGITICSYVPEKNRAVVLLSTMPEDQSVNNENSKPDMINDYNCTKGGVDSLNQLCISYSIARRTRKWPM